MKNITNFVFMMALFSFNSSAFASVVGTQVGKIVATQGHAAPSCRMVLFKETSTGQQLWFRIPNNSNGQDNGIAAVVLSALVANRDVSIYYDPAITTGCGSEPAIQYVTVY